MTKLTEQSLEEVIQKIALMQGKPLGNKPTKLVVSRAQWEIAQKLVAQENQRDWEQEVQFGDN